MIREGGAKTRSRAPVQAMCCFYFIPSKRQPAGWPHPQRLPLGDAFEGCCSAPGHDGAQPGDEELKQCNLGYARCPRLPVERPADAVRFGIGRDTGGELEIAYVCELNYLPGIHGTLVFSRAASAWVSPHSDARIQRKAQCFVETYLQRR
ncbi:MAG: hypothetical protein ABSD88_17905 [Candidatus Korobacteraceae bacterium]